MSNIDQLTNEDVKRLVNYDEHRELIDRLTHSNNLDFKFEQATISDDGYSIKIVMNGRNVFLPITTGTTKSFQSSTYDIVSPDKKAWWSFMLDSYPENYDLAVEYYNDEMKTSQYGALTINSYFSTNGLSKISALKNIIKVDGKSVAKYNEYGEYTLL